MTQPISDDEPRPERESALSAEAERKVQSRIVDEHGPELEVPPSIRTMMNLNVNRRIE